MGSHGIQKGGIRDDSRDHRLQIKQGVDLETLFVTALTAFTGGIGIIAVFAVLTGADICQWSKKGMVGTYLLLSALIWGILLFREFRTQKRHDI